MRHIRRVYLRHFLAAAVILLVCFVLLGSFFAVLSRQYVMSEQRDSMQSNAGQAVRIVSALRPMWDLNTLEMHMALSSISAASGYPMLICDADGVVVIRPDEAEELALRVRKFNENEAATMERIAREGTLPRPWVDQKLEALGVEYID